MLNSLLTLSAGLLPEANPWLSGAITNPPLRTINPLMTPEEPTTLALAIVGLGTIGAFVALKRLRKPAGVEAAGGGVHSVRERTSSVADERRKRGAA